MTIQSVETSPLVYARVAGFGYLVIIVAGIFAELFVRSEFIVPGDAAATANNIAASELLFRIGAASDLVMLAFDVIVAVALYALLRPAGRNLALLALCFRLVHTAVYGATLLTLFLVLHLLTGAYGAAFGDQPLHALVSLFLDAHGAGYRVALVFFGLHCLVLGYLVFKSGFLPKTLGALLVLASLGYLIDSFGNFLLSNYGDYEEVFMLIVAVPAVVAELSVSLWLLIRGVNLSRWQAVAGS